MTTVAEPLGATVSPISIGAKRIKRRLSSPWASVWPRSHSLSRVTTDSPASTVRRVPTVVRVERHGAPANGREP